MNPILVPFDDNLLAHVANYWAFDDWEEADYDRSSAEAARLYGLDSDYRLPVA